MNPYDAPANNHAGIAPMWNSLGIISLSIQLGCGWLGMLLYTMQKWFEADGVELEFVIMACSVLMMVFLVITCFCAMMHTLSESLAKKDGQ